MGWLNKLFQLLEGGPTATKPIATGPIAAGSTTFGEASDSAPKTEAYKRLKLVLMHDRSQIEPVVLEKMRDELVQVISKYVEIDQGALELNFESESNTIALVASIPILRSKPAVLEALLKEKQAQKEAAAATASAIKPGNTTAGSSIPIQEPISEKAVEKSGTEKASDKAITEKAVVVEPKPTAEKTPSKK